MSEDTFGFNINMEEDITGPGTVNSMVGLDGSPQNITPQGVGHGVEPSTISPEQHSDGSLSIWPSAFKMASQTIKNTRNNRRKWIWLAPWSTWSFTMRLMLILGEKLKPSAPPIPKQMLVDDIYDIPLKSFSPSHFPDTRYLPSLDHALYLFNTVKFHLGQTYRFFDDAEFESQIREFYSGHVAQKAAESRLWFAKFLLVLAFGTAFHARPGHAESKDPPGGKFFMQAMSILPDNLQLWRDSLMATEVLAMIGLYLFSIDERESAHVYLGQAIHIAEMEGLHTQLPEDEIGVDTVAWCRDLWWTLYIMDRHFSASVGLPMSVHDSEITTTIHPPDLCSPTDSIRSLQVKLSHLLSMILRTVYKPTQTSLATYIEQTRATLHTLAQYAQELENILSIKFQTSVDTMPKGMRHITLLYHQCVIVATRPLLLSILKERLDMLGRDVDVNWESVLSHTSGIISSGIKSATKTLQILSSEYSLLEVFLPYDLEFTYGAALHLAMANAIFPDVVDDPTSSQTAHGVLSEMVLRGNRVAGVRQAELAHVELLFRQISEQIPQHGQQVLRLPSADANAAAIITGAVDLFPLMPPSESGNADFLDLLDSVGISSEEFFSITEEYSWNPLALAFLSTSYLFFYWMWDSANGQKNAFRHQEKGQLVKLKTFPQVPWQAVENPKVIETDVGDRIMVDGWFAIIRKPNYVPDMFFSFSWGLITGFKSPFPWFYFIFFMVMIIHRTRRDVGRCRRKYGKAWKEYERQVPYLFIPVSTRQNPKLHSGIGLTTLQYVI
ncbi:hypothetical protein CkaCkLH20_09954 [Colletotrichum karsti]|uniref:Xylanolytic transcriptional activator regulatory domain-containing protein n=1 Tax=Colletotrichum karsti TaxID=1095194 RepID=A0A9P6HWE3_9PEZI|nr:uncharacterized protein CkaCkLH20_09954 [Colletotrichum karsti]KAF9872457.1 hypothetical protein CkaCkLH20_09954 [Colletotrichum karsti]